MPLTKSTRGMIDASAIKKMKKGAYLVRPIMTIQVSPDRGRLLYIVYRLMHLTLVTVHDTCEVRTWCCCRSTTRAAQSWTRTLLWRPWSQDSSAAIQANPTTSICIHSGTCPAVRHVAVRHVAWASRLSVINSGDPGDVWPQQPAPSDHPWRTMPNNGDALLYVALTARSAQAHQHCVVLQSSVYSSLQAILTSSQH